MYELNKNLPQNLTQSVFITGAASSEAPETPGVASAMRSLTESVQRLANLADNLKISIGISVPPKQDISSSTTSQTLASLIIQLSKSVNMASNDLDDVLTHLNS